MNLLHNVLAAIAADPKTEPGYRSAAWRLIGQKEAMSAEEKAELMEEKARNRHEPEPRGEDE